MPLPNPSSGEDRSTFVSRCVASAIVRGEFPDQKQALAVCYSQWRKHEAAGKGRGEGIGVGGPRQTDGGTDYCYCPVCGEKYAHERGAPCAGFSCPTCKVLLTGARKSLTSSGLLDRIDNMTKELVKFKPIKVSLVREPATGIPFFVTKENSMGAFAKLFPLSEEDANSLKADVPDQAKAAIDAAVASLSKWKADFPPEVTKALAVLANAVESAPDEEGEGAGKPPLPEKQPAPKPDKQSADAKVDAPVKKPAAADGGEAQEQAAGGEVTLEAIRDLIGEAMREVVAELKGTA